MKRILFILLIGIGLYACKAKVPSHFLLSPIEFNTKISDAKDLVILDVRTADEYKSGHIGNALNYDWNGDQFSSQIETLEKNKPILVYCLSGGRSGEAAASMRAKGFGFVYELDGGILKWKSANLPMQDEKIAKDAMSEIDFEKHLNTDKLVLVDYYAEWCAPCKKMKQYLDEIASTMGEEVIVLRINIDKNKGLSKAKGITALPVLQLYRNRKMIWNHQGYIDKENVLKHLKESGK